MTSEAKTTTTIMMTNHRSKRLRNRVEIISNTLSQPEMEHNNKWRPLVEIDKCHERLSGVVDLNEEVEEEEDKIQQRRRQRELKRQRSEKINLRTSSNGDVDRTGQLHKRRQNYQHINSFNTKCPIILLQICLLLIMASTLSVGVTSPQVSRLAKLQTTQVNSKELGLMSQSVADVELTRRTLQRRDTDTSLVLASAPVTSPVLSTCGYPGSPAHASVTFNTSTVQPGTAAAYTCDNGYELLGPPRRICQTNGTWSPVGIPFCVLNVGLGKAAMQSSTAGGGSAQKAVDGSTSPYFQASTCTMTDVEHNPWWYVNLLEPYLVQIVRIDFGQACCANRQKATIAVRVGNNRPDLGTNPLCNRYHGFIEEGKPLFLPCTRPAPGAFVSIHLESPAGSSLSICETFIYTDHALSIEQCPSFRDQPLGSTATYNGKCYLFHNNQALNFDVARKYCESRGGTLVDETSPALQGFLSWELYRRHRNDQLMGQYWLGAVRDTRNGQNWKWINGRDVQISFWNAPTQVGQNCSRFDGSKGWLWSDTDCQASLNFICQYRPLSCGKPEKPTNSTLITRNIDNGTVIEYQCAPGNLLMGPKSRVCLPTGFFSEFAPKCKYLDCQFPAQITSGDYKLLNGTTSLNSMVTYQCQDGYQLYGRATLTCDLDERWNGPPPRCEPLLCPAPVAPSNGYVTLTSNITIPGTQAIYDCRPNYELVGDRLLSCLTSGSWDQSFPYCREKRSPIAASAAVPPPPQQKPPTRTQTKPNTSANTIQFPNANQPNGLFSPTRLAVTPGTITSSSSSTATPPPALSSTTNASSSPAASLNGLAGQQQQFSNSQVTPTLTSGGGASSPLPPPPPPVVTSESPPLTNENRKPLVMISGDSATSSQLPPRPQLSPVSPRPPQVPSRQQQPQSPTGSSFVSTAAAGSNNKFTFTPTGSSSPGYDSSPLATTNSISVHQSASSSSSSPPPIMSSTSSQHSFAAAGHHHSTTPTNLLSTSGTTSTTTASLATPNVLASFGGGGPAPSSIRGAAHHGSVAHSLANAKYSLDGIIAVAIFGGFIFLGAIITILVIIIRRRKSSQSSSIDAQTISTYDSQAEHNGLYRNYQQAWENLRFSAPGSQPKSSGGGGGGGGGPGVGGLMTGGIGLKNYASPAGVAMLHHAHPIHTTSVVGVSGGGHQNMAMSSSSATSTSSSTSQSSSSLAVTGAAGSGGADPLLGPHHHSSSSAAHHHHRHLVASAAAPIQHHHVYQQQQQHSEDNDDEDDDINDAINHHDDDDEQGVISADEANYGGGGGRAAHRHAYSHHLHHAHNPHHHHHHAHHPHHSEGFRDTNELTINADTATLASQSQGATDQSAIRRRVYSTTATNNNSITALNRRSTGNNLPGGEQQQPEVVNGRLVSTSSTSSTRSSRASDEHSLDRLAYGNNWHHRTGGQ